MKNGENKTVKKRTTTKRRKNKGRVESKEGTKEEMMR